MLLGVAGIAFSSASGEEQVQWKEAAQRESKRYNIAADYVEAGMQGSAVEGEVRPSRTLFDWLLVAGVTCVFVICATMARAPDMAFHWGTALLLVAAMLVLLVCDWRLANHALSLKPVRVHQERQRRACQSSAR
jgi:peptidoglycan/LPS O-acetylase OafA/YrhL